MTTKDTQGSVAGVVGAAALGSVASSDVGSPWYLALDKPAIQPPGPAAGVALIPYAVWCSFATVLSATIWHRNR